LTTEVEERIHKALQSHPLERTEQGYRLIHPGGAGVSLLRLLPVKEVTEGQQVVAVAEIVAEYSSEGLPSFHAVGVQRLNAAAVHGAYHLRNGRLRQIAQFSIYASEPSVHLATQTILNTFGGQLPIGRSTALAKISPEALERQRAHHAMPGQWQNPLQEQALSAATSMLQKAGLAASNNATTLWAEFALSGTCPSRSLDPQAETAVLQVDTGIPHPIAGAGYLARISLPLEQAPADSAEICRRLNALELEQTDFAPRLGAWGLHGPNDLPGYSCFIPSAEPIEGMHVAVMWWCLTRSTWLKERFWVAKQGLQRDRIPIGKLV
jgi:hypothetical protein